MKNSSDINIGNRTRYLPACSTVPQPLRHRVPHVMVLALMYFQTSIFPTNHSVYLQNSATSVSVCLPLKFSAVGNVLTLTFIANNPKHDTHSRAKNSVVLIEHNHILTGIPDRCDSHETLHYASLLRPLWSK